MALPATEPAFKSFSDSYKATMALHNAATTSPPKVDVDPAVSMLQVKVVGSGVGIDFERPSLSSAPQPKPAKSKQASSQQDAELTNLTQYPPLKNLNITLMETKMAAHYLRLKVKTLQTCRAQNRRTSRIHYGRIQWALRTILFMPRRS